jgi:hypothetical protein
VSLNVPKAKKIHPVNSLIFISDPAGGVVPEWVRDVLILSTSSCISVRCYPEQDGPTEVVLGGAKGVDPGSRPAFDGNLETPHRAIAVSTVEGNSLLQSKVPETHTRVRIWVSHPRWPDKVIVGLG